MNQIKEELQKLGIKPVKGQNFLTSEPIIKALVKAGEIENKKVLEIGAGTGKITSKLIKEAKSVEIVEKDTQLANHLEEKFKEEKVNIVNKDFLNYKIPENIERCVSNIPFQISSKTVKKLGENQIQSALIVQEELADKIVAEPSSTSYGHFTIIANYYFVPVKLRTVSKRNFYPEPEVNTAILKLYPNKERHGIENEQYFLKISKALFTHKRKKVRNAFVDARHILEIEKEEAKELRNQVPHSEKRVNQLQIIELKEITEFLSKKI